MVLIQVLTELATCVSVPIALLIVLVATHRRFDRCVREHERHVALLTLQMHVLERTTDGACTACARRISRHSVAELDACAEKLQETMAQETPPPPPRPAPLPVARVVRR